LGISLKSCKESLTCFKKGEIVLKGIKMRIGKTYSDYLGYIAGGAELKIQLSKYEDIMNSPKLNNATYVRSFIGVVSYWRNSITKFPLYHLFYMLLQVLRKYFNQR